MKPAQNTIRRQPHLHRSPVMLGFLCLLTSFSAGSVHAQTKEDVVLSRQEATVMLEP
jgi:hypothetical protein